MEYWNQASCLWRGNGVGNTTSGRGGSAAAAAVPLLVVSKKRRSFKNSSMRQGFREEGCLFKGLARARLMTAVACSFGRIPAHDYFFLSEWRCSPVRLSLLRPTTVVAFFFLQHAVTSRHGVLCIHSARRASIRCVTSTLPPASRPHHRRFGTPPFAGQRATQRVSDRNPCLPPLSN